MAFDVVELVEGGEYFFHKFEDCFGLVAILLGGLSVPIAYREFSDPDRLSIHAVYFFQSLEKGCAIGSSVGMDADEVDSELRPFGCRHELLHPIVIGVDAARGAEAQSGFHEEGPVLERFLDAHVGLVTAVGFVEAK